MKRGEQPAPQQAELAADLRAASRRVQELERTLVEVTERADHLEVQLAAKTREAARIAIERDEFRERLEALQQQQAREAVAEARLAAELPGALAQAFAPLITQNLEAMIESVVRQRLRAKLIGRVFGATVRVAARCFAYKDIPENGNGSRKSLIEGVRLAQRLGQFPVLLHFEAEGGSSCTALLCAELGALGGQAPAASSAAAPGLAGQPLRDSSGPVVPGGPAPSSPPAALEGGCP